MYLSRCSNYSQFIMEHQNWKVSYIIPKGKPAEEKKDTKGGTLRTNKKMPGKAPYLVDEESMSGRRVLYSSSRGPRPEDGHHARKERQGLDTD